MDKKTTLRAQMAMAGMSQGMLAAEMGVETRSVRRWVSESYQNYQPPQDALDILADHLAQQREVVGCALAKVDEIAGREGHAPDHVELRYWATQGGYDANHVPADGGDYRLANANSVATAQVLAMRGIRTEWVRGEIS